MIKRSSIRILTALIGAALLLISLTGLIPSAVGIVFGGFGLFLAATDFGRQCPLLLSFRHLLARIRHRRSGTTIEKIDP